MKKLSSQQISYDFESDPIIAIILNNNLIGDEFEACHETYFKYLFSLSDSKGSALNSIARKFKIASKDGEVKSLL